ncbi:UTP:RNA uridylyltransferase 1 [Mercurialis annua]|uniref:UTP:RNA uridylyltransferase 1 n=1 Tax=Mercurialis annua TaxID=3986 RepID=UPI00215FAF84|nr:UTP:RNA uridylyltransferase 1 [Mercurialis annua]
MNDGGANAPPMQPASNGGGEFLLSLLRNHQSQQQSPLHQQQQPPQFPIPIPMTPSHHQQQQQTVNLDPAVAAVGPSMSYPTSIWQSNGRDVLSSPSTWSHNFSPPNLLPGLLGYSTQNHHQHNPWQNNFYQGSSQGGVFGSGDDIQRLGFSSGNNTIHNQLEQNLQFGSFNTDNQTPESLHLNAKLKELEFELGIRNLNGLEGNHQFDSQLRSNLRAFDPREQGRNPLGGTYRSQESRMPPPGFSSMSRGGGGGGGGGGNWDFATRSGDFNHNVNKEKGNFSELSKRNAYLSDNRSLRDGDGLRDLGLTVQLDRPGPPAGSNLHSVSAFDIEESLLNLDAGRVEDRIDEGDELDGVGEELVDSLLLESESNGNIDKKQIRPPRDKEYRSDNRGKRILSQRMRMLKRQMECRRDIDRFNVHFLAIYESLTPPEEEISKQKQLLTLLEKLVNREWPEARLYLYGSCANSFGVLKSDIDVCLAIGDADVNKSEVLLKLADILQSDNLQNVQALTRARVPIVKLMDPVTGISCDICINNVLAVVNTKLLWDYAQIDVRVRQLAFIVKHWAKSRGVNATYQGTLSSYAYVLMCIHFLQQRRPAILPCLQGMDTTYTVNVDGIECAYFDKVEKLRGFGFRNKETIAQLVWAFFSYWAYRHDYSNDVISVRKGALISKHEKDWTRRVGNDRHLICIEDPFETSHDLGRVVDKYSIKVLREEFERAANIMQYDPNPCVALFEPYVPS